MSCHPHAGCDSRQCALLVGVCDDLQSQEDHASIVLGSPACYAGSACCPPAQQAMHIPSAHTVSEQHQAGCSLSSNHLGNACGLLRIPAVLPTIPVQPGVTAGPAWYSRSTQHALHHSGSMHYISTYATAMCLLFVKTPHQHRNVPIMWTRRGVWAEHEP